MSKGKRALIAGIQSRKAMAALLPLRRIPLCVRPLTCVRTRRIRS